MILPRLSISLGWQHYLLGGVLIGTGVALLFVLVGLVGGMSTVFSSTWSFVVPRPSSSRRASPARGAGAWCTRRPGAGCVGVVGFGGPGGCTIDQRAGLATAGRRVSGGLRCPAEQWLHLGPRHLRAGVDAVALAAGGADLHGHSPSHGEPGGTVVADRRTHVLPRFLAVLLAGALFGFGLALSTVVQPEVVLGFLRFEDFGLMLVMGGAVVITLLAYAGTHACCHAPLLGGSFAHPSAWNRDTAPGRCAVGVGWGLCGVCPGPAIAGLGTGNWTAVGAVASRWALWHRDYGRGRAAATPAHVQAKVSSKTPGWWTPSSAAACHAAHPLPPMTHCGVRVRAQAAWATWSVNPSVWPAPGLRCAGLPVAWTRSRLLGLAGSAGRLQLELPPQPKPALLLATMACSPCSGVQPGPPAPA